MTRRSRASLLECRGADPFEPIRHFLEIPFLDRQQQQDLGREVFEHRALRVTERVGDLLDRHRLQRARREFLAGSFKDAGLQRLLVGFLARASLKPPRAVRLS